VIEKQDYKASKNFDAWLADLWNNDRTRDWNFFQKEGTQQ